MQVSVSGHHYTVSERTRTYVEEEMAGLEKFFSPLVDVHATISEEGGENKVDLVVNVHAHTLKSSGGADKIYPAIDQAINRMISQLKKLKAKQKDHRGESHEEPSIEE